MKSKTKQKNVTAQIHNLPAGMMPGDNATELFGCRETKQVYGISNGKTIPFTAVCPDVKASIFSMMLSDDNAMADLKGLPHDEALEQFTFCVYGAADHVPDVDENGNLGRADNFLCSTNCRCLKWASKSITLNGHNLSLQQIQIVQLLATDMPDKEIAERMCISESTLDYHKRNIYSIAGVHSKAGLIMLATEQKVIQ